MMCSLYCSLRLKNEEKNLSVCLEAVISGDYSSADTYKLVSLFVKGRLKLHVTQFRPIDTVIVTGVL